MAAYTPATELARLVRDTLGPLPLVTSDVVHRDRERAEMAAADTRDYERSRDAVDRLDDNYRRLLQDFDDAVDRHYDALARHVARHRDSVARHDAAVARHHDAVDRHRDVVQTQDARIRQLTDENRNHRINMDQLRQQVIDARSGVEYDRVQALETETHCCLLLR